MEVHTNFGNFAETMGPGKKYGGGTAPQGLAVDISTTLIDQINDLLTGIKVGPQRLLEPLGALRRDFRLAVRSYVGCS